MINILVVEDDISLSNGIVLALKSSEYCLKQAYTLAEAEMLVHNQKIELIILDINLPDGNGLDFLKKLRTFSAIPIIILTANDMETDIVVGLELGADDYITKPFSLMVLRARVNTQLKHLSMDNSREIIINDFRFDFSKMEFFKKEQSIELSKTEQKLLRLLVDNINNVLSRDMLIEKIWSNGSEFVDENALSVTIKRLRDKLEDIPAKPKYIKTVYGIGYTWNSEK